jgi:hypothetical protein
MHDQDTLHHGGDRPYLRLRSRLRSSAAGWWWWAPYWRLPPRRPYPAVGAAAAARRSAPGPPPAKSSLQKITIRLSEVREKGSLELSTSTDEYRLTSRHSKRVQFGLVTVPEGRRDLETLHFYQQVVIPEGYSSALPGFLKEEGALKPDTSTEEYLLLLLRAPLVHHQPLGAEEPHPLLEWGREGEGALVKARKGKGGAEGRNEASRPHPWLAKGNGRRGVGQGKKGRGETRKRGTEARPLQTVTDLGDGVQPGGGIGVLWTGAARGSDGDCPMTRGT